MLRVEVFNTFSRYFLRWVLYFDRASAISRHVLHADWRMLRISQSAQMCGRDFQKISDVFERMGTYFHS